MQIVKPSVTLIEKNSNIGKHIERCGRVCYQSLDKITNTSYKPFIKMITDKKHLSVLEHGRISFLIDVTKDHPNELIRIINSNYSDKYEISESIFKIDTNLRVVFENNYIIEDSSLFQLFIDYYSDDKELSNDIKMSLKTLMITPVPKDIVQSNTYTFEIIADRATINQILRHRRFSFLQESTRYCNYNNDKMLNRISVLIPDKINNNDAAIKEILDCYSMCEATYMKLIKLGILPEDARVILPLGLKSTLIMTGSKKDYMDFINKRTVTGVQKEIENITKDILKEIINK